MHKYKRYIAVVLSAAAISAATQTVCYADTNYFFTDQSNFSDSGSGNGDSQTHSYSGRAGGGSSNGANVHVDNEHETQYKDARNNAKSILQSLMSRARTSQGANTMIGDLLKNGSGFTFGYVTPTQQELLALFNDGTQMVNNMSGAWRDENFNFGAPFASNNFDNIYQYSDSINASSGNNGMPSATVSSDISVTDGDGAGYAQNEHPVGGGSVVMPSMSFGGQGVPAQWGDFMSLFNGANGITENGNGGFAAFSGEFSSLFRNFWDDPSNPLGPGMGMTGSPSSPSLMPFYNMTSPDELGNYTGGIRNDLIMGGFNIANTYAGRFTSLNKYTSNAMNNTQCTFGLLTEYRLTNVRTNDRTNIHFMGDVRYWRVYDEGGNPVAINGSYNLVTTNPEHTLQLSGLPDGTYTVRAYQLARYTIQTTVSYMQYEYFFDTSNNSILYFHERQMSPIVLNSVEMQGEIPSRSFQFTSGDLSTESAAIHSVERIE